MFHVPFFNDIHVMDVIIFVDYTVTAVENFINLGTMQKWLRCGMGFL